MECQNSKDPDQTATVGVVLSGSALFAKACLSQNLGSSRYIFAGHNMGSEHDPETDDCAPSERDDGKYVMYPWAVDGYDKNNLVSEVKPCSFRLY